MSRKSVIVGIVVAILVVAGLAFMVVRDARNANDEIYAYRSEIIDIRDEAGKSTNLARLKSLAIRLDTIRTALSYIPSNHRLAAWFVDLHSPTSKAMNEAVSVAIPINKRID
jgi:hypothetical protein